MKLIKVKILVPVEEEATHATLEHISDALMDVADGYCMLGEGSVVTAELVEGED